MLSGRLFWRMFPSLCALMLASVVALTWYAAVSVTSFYRNCIENDQADCARLLRLGATEPLRKGDTAELQRLARAWGAAGPLRVTIIAPDGSVLADSAESPTAMENHADRPEVSAARDGEVGQARRFSYTLKADYQYTAVPVEADGKLLGVLRVSRPATELDATVRALVLRMALGAAAVLVAATALIYSLARGVARSVGELRQGAVRFAHGELAHKLTPFRIDEFDALATALNRMAATLDERIRALLRQRNEADAVLASMVEGVIAVDTSECVISVNQACARLLGVDAHRVQGHSLPEVVRNLDLQRLVAEVLDAQAPISQEITLHQQGPCFLEAHGTVLRDAGGHGIGVLVVLHDVTRLRRLENVRRDFVANVSHELRTPITSIKGFVETLVDGAINDPEDAARFLQIIAAQTDRLSAIIEDLLMLSRVEQEHEKGQVAVEVATIKPVLESAAGVCQLKAEEKQVGIEILCDDALTAPINVTLLEQALVNLIDNAIKYSPNGETIHLEAEAVENELLLRVRDHGCGIPREHLPRIFERFYRVDKARSRKLGGTGLGLAIVKHIAQSHGGRTTVESTLAVGSTFTLHLPLESPEPAEAPAIKVEG